MLGLCYIPSLQLHSSVSPVTQPSTPPSPRLTPVCRQRSSVECPSTVHLSSSSCFIPDEVKGRVEGGGGLGGGGGGFSGKGETNQSFLTPSSDPTSACRCGARATLVSCSQIQPQSRRDQEEGSELNSHEEVQEEGGELDSHEQVRHFLRVQARPRGERWCWTLKTAQKRSKARRWSWA